MPPSYRSCPLTVERYSSFIRSWLKAFSNVGKKAANRLDTLLEATYFPEILFSSIAKTLVAAKEFACQDAYTIKKSGLVRNANFSPDGYHLVTASADYTAKIWGLVDGQLQEKDSIQHSSLVKKASFSPDGHHLVTISNDNTAKIWGLARILHE